MKLQFEDVDITGSNLTKKLSVEKDHLEEDFNLITKISDLAKNIVQPHQVKPLKYNINNYFVFENPLLFFKDFR